GHDVLHREYHVRRIPRACVRAAAAAQAHGAGGTVGQEERPRRLDRLTNARHDCRPLCRTTSCSSTRGAGGPAQPDLHDGAARVFVRSLWDWRLWLRAARRFPVVTTNYPHGEITRVSTRAAAPSP